MATLTAMLTTFYSFRLVHYVFLINPAAGFRVPDTSPTEQQGYPCSTAASSRPARTNTASRMWSRSGRAVRSSAIPTDTA